MLAVLRICQVGDCEIEIIGTFPYPIRTKLQLEVAKFIVMVIVLSVANQAEQCGGLALLLNLKTSQNWKISKEALPKEIFNLKKIQIDKQSIWIFL